MMRKAFTLIELLVVLAIIAILLSLLGVGVVEVPVQLLIGWIVFLVRSIQEMSVDWDGVVIGLVCTALLLVGVHSFGKWLTRHRAARLPAEAAKPEWRWSATFAVVGVVVLMFVAGISAIGITHQSYWLATSPERWFEGNYRGGARVQSMNSLKQVAIGAHAIHDIEKRLPPGMLLDSAGRALHGWPTLLLPYIEQDALFKQIDLTKPWHHPAQAALFKTEMFVYLNPMLDAKDAAGNPLSHYAGNVHVLAPGKRLTLKDITDGAANTILYGEVAAHLQPWGAPWHLRDPARGFGKAPSQFDGPTGRGPEGVCVSFADGSVRFLSKDTSPEVLRVLATPAGGEKLPENWDH